MYKLSRYFGDTFFLMFTNITGLKKLGRLLERKQFIKTELCHRLSYSMLITLHKISEVHFRASRPLLSLIIASYTLW